MKIDESRRLLSRNEVEETYGISRRFLEVSASNGAGPRLVRVGRLVRYRVADIEAWIDANSSDGGN